MPRGHSTHKANATVTTWVPTPRGQCSGVTLCWKPWWKWLTYAVGPQARNHVPQGGTLSAKSMSIPKKAHPRMTRRPGCSDASHPTSITPNTKSATPIAASGAVGPPCGTPNRAWESKCGVKSSRK
jgi:hypothetical protein